jgi:hypothetical protein
MSATELDEVQALLEHVLPDPTGYAQRLALQFMTRWGQSARSDASAPYAPPAAQDFTLGDIMNTPDQPGPDEPPVDTNLLLATALGACECWGLRADCDSCRGYGSAGWAQPDPELFEEFVRPAIARMPGASADGREPEGGGNTGEDRHHHQAAEGVSP